MMRVGVLVRVFFVIGGVFCNGVVGDFTVDKSVIQQPGTNIFQDVFKELKCKGFGVRFENGYFKIASSSIKPLPSNDISFVAWIRVRKTDQATTLYSTVAANGGKQVLEVQPSTAKMVNGRLKWTVNADKTNTVFSVESDDVIPSGIWTHIVAKYDGKQGRAYIFVNGAKLTKVKEVPKAAKLPWGKDVVIGGLTDDQGKVTQAFTGGMIGIRFVEKPLSDDEINLDSSSCKPQQAGKPYLVTVCTVDKLFAGTNSKVHIKVFGADGQFGETLIGEKFRSGCSKAITIYGPSVGIINKISVRKEQSRVDKTWKLEKIVISADSMPNKAEKYTFICKKCKFSNKDGLQEFIDAVKEDSGGWSIWSDWSGCGSGKCGGDSKVRTRACTNPEPSKGGQKCKKNDGSFGIFEAETQACPVDGNWGAWTSWSDCDKICGGSTVKRTRKCDNPAPGKGGKKCVGADSETKQDCTDPCEDWPVHGNWADWSQWSACSKTCGGAVITRKRTCTNPAPLRGGQACEGDDTETATDCTNHCPIDGGWKQWGPWGDCSTSCGPGQRTRERKCENPFPAFGGKPCPGQDKETEKCQTRKCPNSIDGKWGSWGQWSACSETQFCDQGEKTRTRKCDSPAPSNGGEFCPGMDTEEEICPKDKCKPVNGDSIQVKPQSYIGSSCESNTAYFAGEKGTKYKDIPTSIFTNHLKPIADVIKTSYFSQTKEKDGVTKFCFQLASAVPIKTLVDKKFKEYGNAKSLPDFDKPALTEKTNGIAVALNASNGGSLYSVEFSLGDSKKYSPIQDVDIEDVRFVFREISGQAAIVAYGKHKIIKNEFKVEVTPGPLIVGESSGTTNLGTMILELSPKTDVYASEINGQMGKAIKDLFIKKVAAFTVANVPVSGLTEAGNGAVRRISGTVSSGNKELYHVETLSKDGKNFIIGVTADKTNLKNTIEKIFEKKPPDVFGEFVGTTIGIGYSPIAFAIGEGVEMQREPLKSAYSQAIKQGILVAMKATLPPTCNKAMCKAVKFVIGEKGELLFTGNIRLDGLDLIAAILNRKITDRVRLSKIEFYIKVTYKPPVALFGINFELAIAVKDDVYKDNILQPKKELIFNIALDVTTTSEITLTGAANNAVWKNAFGKSWLSFKDFYISIGFSAVTAGWPSKFAVGTTVIFGKDCYEAKDFTNQGHCIEGKVDMNIAPLQADMYFIGELDAVTIGKLFRMLGSKLELPKIVAKSGFPEKVLVSFSFKSQTLTYLQTPRQVKSGFFLKGKCQLLGLPSVEISVEISTSGMELEVELGPLNIRDKFMIVRSLTEKTKGPKFSMKATTAPLQAEVFLQGAMKIFGVETEILFQFRPRLVEAQVKIALTILKLKLEADVHVKAEYGDKPLKDFNFWAKIKLSAHKVKIEQEAIKETERKISKAKVLLRAAKDKLSEEKEKCKKQVGVYCTQCQDIKCEQVTDSCNEAIDSFKNYIGGAANKFGGWFVGIARKIAKTFKTERERRHAEYFPGRTQMATRIRRKRYVGRYFCKDLMPKICAKTKTFCEASCKLPEHITKGVCKGLDMAHQSLYRTEDLYYWVKKTVPKYLLKIHEISLELELQPSLINTAVTASIDLTFLNVRKFMEVTLTLQDVVDAGIVIANKAIEFFGKLVKPRYTEPNYDRPSNVGDYKIGAAFKIINGNEMCLSSPNDQIGSTFGTGLCTGKDSLWVFTLTGELMNVGSERCLTFSGTGKDQKVDQQECKIGAQNQHFTCSYNRIQPVDDPSNCVIQNQKSVKMAPCEKEPEDVSKEFVIPKEEEWTIGKMHSVCDNYVEDLALNKPAEQSSLFSQKELDATELQELESQIKETVLKKVGPELAVDGNMNFDITAGSCAHTALSKDPWWRVDLQAEYIITDVSIQTAEENVKVDALENFEVRVGMQKSFEKNPMCGSRVKGIHLGELWTSTCDPPIPGQYVSIQSIGQTRLALCEVAVYSRRDNQGKCSAALRRKRTEIATVCHRDRIFRRPAYRMYT